MDLIKLDWTGFLVMGVGIGMLNGYNPIWWVLVLVGLFFMLLGLYIEKKSNEDKVKEN